jgi:hypothetical protein
MFTSLNPVSCARARFCTPHDRGDIWFTITSSEHALPEYGSLAEGLLDGRQVATDSGWRAVETLKPGDMVLTFDNGMQKLVDRISAPVAPDPRTSSLSMRCVSVPRGAIGNRRDITLLPSQLVLLECDYAAARFGDPFILVQAGALVGYRGITRGLLPTKMKSHMLAFKEEQIIHTDGSALLWCHATQHPTRTGARLPYRRLTNIQVDAFLSWIKTTQTSTPAKRPDPFVPQHNMPMMLH